MVKRKAKIKEVPDISKTFKNATEAELKAYIRSAGKKANERLRTLEGAYSKSHTSYIKTSPAYKHIDERVGVYKGVFSRTGYGEIKFATSTRNFDIETLKRRASVIEGFLEAKTSKVKGVRERTQKIYESYLEYAKENAEAQGIDPDTIKISRKKFDEYWDSAIIENMVNQFGSEAIEETIFEFAKNKLSIEKVEAMLKSVGFDEDTSAEDYFDRHTVQEVYDVFRSKRNNATTRR